LRVTNQRGHCLTVEEEEALFKALAESEWVGHIVHFRMVGQWMAMRYTHATNANMKQAVRSLDSLSVRLGNVLATKTKTAGAVPP
jgi:hypothetical protein